MTPILIFTYNVYWTEDLIRSEQSILPNSEALLHLINPVRYATLILQIKLRELKSGLTVPQKVAEQGFNSILSDFSACTEHTMSKMMNCFLNQGSQDTALLVKINPMYFFKFIIWVFKFINFFNRSLLEICFTIPC